VIARCRRGSRVRLPTPFATDRRLSDKDISTLAAWVDGGTPEGDPKDAPAAAKFVNGLATRAARLGPDRASRLHHRRQRDRPIPLLCPAGRAVPAVTS